MKAIEITQYGAPEVLRAGERPDPVAAAGEVLIRVTASGVNRPDVLQLHAINALTYVGPAAKSALPAIEAASQRRSPGSSYAADETSRPYVEYVRRCAEHLLAILAGTYNPAAAREQPPEACRRGKGFALKAIGSEGTFPN